MQSPHPLELSDPTASDVSSTHPELNGNALAKSETTSTELAKVEVRLSDPRAKRCGKCWNVTAVHGS